MNETIIAAWVAAVSSPIITFVITKAYEARFLNVLTPSRRSVLTGKWTGSRLTEIGPDGKPFAATMTLQLVAGRKLVTGTTSHHGMAGTEERGGQFTVSGGFSRERYLRLTYDTIDRGAIQFGTMILELDADGRCLKGRFLGYGRVSERLVFGLIELKKIA